MGLIAGKEYDAQPLIPGIKKLVALSLEVLRVALVELDDWSHQVMCARDLKKVETIGTDLADFLGIGLIYQVLRETKQR